MQRVVLDGVRRQSASGVRPQALILGDRRERPAALSQNSMRVGFDGVRRQATRPVARPIAAPQPAITTPRELLENIVEPVETAPFIPAVAPKRRSFMRPMIGFSMLASAFIVAGLTGSHFVNANAASDSASRSLVAAIATATPAPIATPAPTATPTPVAASSAQAVLDAFVAAKGSQYTIYVKDLKSGAVASSNASKTMMSASLYKLFVAQRIYQMIDSGDLTYAKVAGAESGGNTIEGCLKLMITISDNACGHDLGKIVGWGKYDATLKVAGFTSTSLGNTNGAQPSTNAKDVGLLFERLYTGTSMSPNSTDRFIALLKSQRVNDRLPKGLPTGTIFAHKTGDLAGYTHDAGIVYGKKTDFLVVVMSGPWNTPESSKPAFGTLATQLNNLFNN